MKLPFGLEIRNRRNAPLSAASLLIERALMHLKAGDVSAARQCAERAISMCPDDRGYDTLSRIMLPGEHYYNVLRRFHDHLRPKNYLEIGVDTGASLVLAKFPTVVVGIDPVPRLNCTPTTICKIFPMMSGEYFATRDVRSDLEGETANLVFIDGQHLFEQPCAISSTSSAFQARPQLCSFTIASRSIHSRHLDSEKHYFGLATCGRSSYA